MSTSYRTAAALAIGATLLAGIQTKADARGNAQQIVVAQSSDVLTLDPSIDTSPISLNLFKNIYDQLTDIAADGSVQPQLAIKWEASADTTDWVFTIRTDAKFHDGQPVTAEDVAWSYKKVLADPKSPVNAYLNNVKSVEARGADKVHFVLNGPFAPWARQVSLISILPQKIYEKMGSTEFAQHPVGSGAYKALAWVKDDKVELEANTAYWGGAPQIKKVIFKPVPSEASRVAGLASGELDVVPVLPPAALQRLESAPDVRIERVKSNRVVYFGFDVRNPLFSSVKLRQAIDMSIDREAITGKLLRGLGVPLGQMAAPVTFGYDPAIKPTAYNPTRARELVKESGYKGEPLPLQFPNNRYAFGSEVVQAAAGYMKEVGINVELQGMEYAAFFPLWAQAKLPNMHMFAFGPSIMDADLPLRDLYGPNARGYWLNDEVQKLMAQERADSHSDKRLESIAKIWKISQENAPYVILYSEIQAYGITTGLKWAPRPDERLLFGKASF